MTKMDIEIFNEKYNYDSSAFVEKLKNAAVRSAAVNFMFSKTPSPEALCRINNEIRKYTAIADIGLSLGRPQDGVQNIADYGYLSCITNLHTSILAINSLIGVQQFSSLNKISVSYTAEKDLDLSPLEQCNRLENLSIERRLTKKQHQILSRLSVLKKLNVHGLNISSISTIQSLTFLEAHGLLEPKQMPEKLPNLKELVIVSSNGLTDLDFISEMVLLENLRILGPLGGITTLPDFSRSKHLVSLYLRDMKRLCNIDNLQSLSKLKSLRLGGNINLAIEELAWFKQSAFPHLESFTFDLKSKTLAKTLETTFKLQDE